MSLIIKKALSDGEINQCMNIRFKVFVEGQNVPMQEEVDGKDAEASQYLLLIDDHPIGVARVRSMDHYFKIERVAILDEYQEK